MNRTDRLILTTDGPVALVKINRPEVLNALDAALLEEIDEVFKGLEETPEVGAVVLTGEGDRAFAAGADVRELSALSPLEARRRSLLGQRVLGRIEALSKPVIAAINGYCLGGGLELALACHLRVASESALLGLPEVGLGLIPGYGGTQRLPRLVGRATALEWILTGEQKDAREALRIGLVSRVVPGKDLVEECRSLAARLLENGPVALSCALAAVRVGAEMPLREALDYEATLFGLTAASEDMKEGTRAFLEKRKARFRGR